MATQVTEFQARCPLCGSPVLTVARHGHALADEVHTIDLGRSTGWRYTLCDDCGILADLPRDLTLN
jgi:hypothetical protein